MMVLKRVVVATDFSEVADVALMYGRELARTFGARLDVLHVTDNFFARAYGGDTYIAACPQMQSDVDEAAALRLAALMSDEDRAQLGASAIVRSSTSPAAAIVGYAAETRADVIVIGTHGRGAMARLVMGSVAERVVRTAPCPVLTVRHPEHEFVLPDALVAVGRA
jgi:nucleotide-binding universal stress UspA family protein